MLKVKIKKRYPDGKYQLQFSDFHGNSIYRKVDKKDYYDILYYTKQLISLDEVDELLEIMREGDENYCIEIDYKLNKLENLIAYFGNYTNIKISSWQILRTEDKKCVLIFTTENNTTVYLFYYDIPNKNNTECVIFVQNNKGEIKKYKCQECEAVNFVDFIKIF